MLFLQMSSKTTAYFKLFSEFKSVLVIWTQKRV